MRIEISPKNPTKNKNETENAELSKKLHLNKLKKGKANIVFEKHDDKQKEKKARQADDVDYCAELIEKKKARNAAYEQYKQRGGARNPGSKPIPEVRSSFIFLTSENTIFLITKFNSSPSHLFLLL